MHTARATDVGLAVALRATPSLPALPVRKGAQQQRVGVGSAPPPTLQLRHETRRPTTSGSSVTRPERARCARVRSAAQLSRRTLSGPRSQRSSLSALPAAAATRLRRWCCLPHAPERAHFGRLPGPPTLPSSTLHH